MENQFSWDLSELERNVNYYENLKSAISKSEQEKKELEIHNMALKQGNEQLERINAAFEVALQQGKEELAKAIHELAVTGEMSASRLEAASNIAVKSTEYAVNVINTSLNSTKAKIEEIGTLADVSVEQYKSYRQFLDS